MTPDDRLKAALGLGVEPPPVDHAFVARVAERIEAQRFRLKLSVLALWACVAALLCWVLVPVIEQVNSVSATSIRPVVAGLLVAGGVWFLRHTSVGEAVRLARRVVRRGTFQAYR